MKVRWLAPLFFLLGTILIYQSCSGPAQVDEKPGETGKKEEKAETGREGAKADGGPVDEGGIPEGKKPDQKGGQNGCKTTYECPKGECKGGKCVKTTSCSKHNQCPLYKMCYKKRCVSICQLDTDCPEGYVCTRGLCHKPNWKEGKPPKLAGKVQPLRAGLGVAEMDFPLGVSMAGYGFRPGPRGPYAEALGGSTGLYDRLQIKALALDNGKERLILVRSPLIFTSDYLVTQVAQEIIRQTGENLLPHLVVVSTHTHSAPARFWNLLNDLGFGSFGGGNFMSEVFMRLARSFAKAIIQANKNLQPARLGYLVYKNFDPENKIFSDRRGESPNYKNPHLTLIRVDRANGDPLALLVNFPMHGTIMVSTFITGDAAAGLEFQLQDYLEKKLKQRIEVFFMQGSAGDISPRGDFLGHKGVQRLQMLGAAAAPMIAKHYFKIKTSDTVPIELISKRIPISRKHIGYKPDEFYDIKLGKKIVYHFGAFQCVKKGYSAKSPKRHQDGKLGCMFDLRQLVGGPIPQFTKTKLSALRFGELAFVTYPGEVTAHLAKKTRDIFLQKNQNSPIKNLEVFGYAQDHQLYILDEDDWWKGGYEASMSVWGPKFGEYLMKENLVLAQQLLTPQKEENKTGILPMDFYGIDLNEIKVPRKVTPDAGTMVKQPPKVYKRMEKPFSFTFKGGYNGVDLPRAILQKRRADGTFEDYLRNGVRVYDDTDHRMYFEYKESNGSYLYTFYFEELWDFPTGTYRFRIEGRKWDGQKIVPYQLTTEPFEIVPTDKIDIWQITLRKDRIQVWLSYPRCTNDDGKNQFDKLEPCGHRLRSAKVSWMVGPPLEPGNSVDSLQIEIYRGGNKINAISARALNKTEVKKVKVVIKRDINKKEYYKEISIPAVGFEYKFKKALPSGNYRIKVKVKDLYGNTGAAEKTANL